MAPDPDTPSGPTGCILVLVTAASVEEATAISEAVLERRVAACVSVLPGLVSRFWWEGAIDTAQEVLLLIKTRREHFDALVETIGSQHSYNVFEALALDVSTGNPPYIAWVREETG